MLSLQEKSSEKFYQDEEETMLGTVFSEVSILKDDEKIGYYEVFETYDDDGDLSSAYVKSIGITEENRNKGYGTEVLKMLAEKYGKIYLYPDNDKCEHLYKRLGEVTEDYPEELQCEVDNSGIMYVIEA